VVVASAPPQVVDEVPHRDEDPCGDVLTEVLGRRTREPSHELAGHFNAGYGGDDDDSGAQQAQPGRPAHQGLAEVHTGHDGSNHDGRESDWHISGPAGRGPSQ
jgi:hypothetical protein